MNSVTGEDERLEVILPIVARHGAAVIGLANDDEIRIEPEERLAIAKKIVSAAGDHGIPPEDVVIDPLAMPIGARAARRHRFHRDGAPDPRASSGSTPPAAPRTRPSVYRAGTRSGLRFSRSRRATG